MAEGPFFSAYAETDAHRRHLPHWQQGEAWCFVTWRLADSLPEEKLGLWRAEREAWLRRNPEPWDEATEADYHERFSHRIDEWLDQGCGTCLLREAANAQVVAAALRHFDGARYVMGAFAVMPNHVHVLFRPLGGHLLADVIRSWKGFSAREINHRLSRNGTVWQDEYWDRLVRSERHLLTCAAYIRNNPAAAKLHPNEYLWESKF